MQKKHSIIVGVFIVIGLMILVITILTLGNQRKAFVKKLPIKVVFTDINGLQAGNNVWFSGVKIGTVKQVKLKGNSLVEVTLAVDMQAQPFIHIDSRVKIGSDGFIGNRIIIIYGGTPAARSVAKNDYLEAEKILSTEDMMATLQANNKNLLEITNNFKQVSQKIANGSGTLGALVNDKSLFNNIQSAVNGLKTTLANFKATSVESKEFMQNLVTFSDNLNREGTTIHKLVTDTSLFDGLTGAVKQFKQAATSATEFADTLKLAGSKLNTNNNPVGLLLNDKETADKVKIIIQNIASSTQKLDEDLEALQHNFLLRGYFRKKNKNK